MGRYLIIEQDLKSQLLAQDTLKVLDTQANIECFDNFQTFQKKLSHFNETELKEFLSFDLSILDFGQLPLKDWRKKFDEFLGLPRKATPICFTGFETAGLSLKFIQQFEIYNFIFKPTDPLILKETLNLALQSQKRAQGLEIKSQKAAAFIGILKEVELESISELGFVTLSDASIPLQSISKYFCSLFKVGRKQSTWAQCVVSLPHPQRSGFFINKFQFYGVDKMFLNQIRRHIQAHKQDETSSALWNLAGADMGKTIKMALVGADNVDNHHFKTDLELRFKNLKVDFVHLGVDQLGDKTEHDFDLVLNLSDLGYEAIKSFFKPSAVFFLMTAVQPLEEDLHLLATQYRDVFIQPYDKSYFYKKLKVHVADLVPAEEFSLSNITSRTKMKAANKARFTEINELFINLVYPRELPYKTFREFIFLHKDEDQAIEIPAFCHFAEKNKGTQPGEGPTFFHQFVFFGMTDHFLKEIRLWLLHNHIVQSGKG